MRKILFALASSLFIATSYADLGAIAVSSFLNQRLNATIPINGFGSKVDYNNFAVDLAGKDKFQQSGITFNPELASLNFTVMKTNRGNIIKISSSRPIKSPVLSFVLHYKVNNNDFYRQYTILLDPLEYSADNSGVINSEPNKANRVIIARNDNASYRPSVKPIPLVKSKNSTKTQAITQSVSFDADFNNNYVQQHLKQFNQSSFSYTTVKNDTIYNIAKFEQALYPKADLSINQIIIALGMENYRDLHPLNSLYESGAEIFLPEAKDVALIPSDAADDYLLNTQLTNPQKIALLTQIAAKFDPNLEVDSPNLFSDINPMLQGSRVNQESALSKMKQKFAIVEPAPKPDNSILDMLFDYKYYILGVFLSLGLILVFRARAKKSRQLADNIIPLQFSNPQYIDPVDEANIAALDDSHFTIDNIVPVHLQMPEPSMANPVYVTHEPPVAEKLPDLDMTPAVIHATAVRASEEVVPAVDDELIHTLEQILTFDDGRDDIRLKLFELHLSGNQTIKANTVYDNLNSNLASDDPLRKSLTEICSRYNYAPLNASPDLVTESVSESELVATHEADSNINVVDDNSANILSFETEQQPLIDTSTMDNKEDANHQMDYTQIKTTPSQIDNSFVTQPLLDEEDINRSLDFSSSTILQSTPTENLVESIDFDAERVMDFGSTMLATNSVENVTSDFEHALTSGSEFIPPDPLDPNEVEYEEKLNLSRMYYHIDEHQKARELLLEMKQNAALPDKFKTQVNQLLADLGLDA
jgi:hypothetical protein